MNIPNIPNYPQTMPPGMPVSSLAANTQPPAQRRHFFSTVFDRFQSLQTHPDIRIGFWEQLGLILRHPIQSRTFKRIQRPDQSGESPLARMKMYFAIRKTLDPASRDMFENLLREGVLSDTKTDDGHSTLYHIYAMLTTRRAPGYNGQILVKEMVHILSRPYIITQEFAPLSENVARQILQIRTNPNLLNRTVIQRPFKEISWKDLNVSHGATCVAASTMYYMADREPGELARHLNELTSPLNAFFEKARIEEISPDDPSKAYDILREHDIRFYETAPGELVIRVENPPAGELRAIDSQKVILNREKETTPDGKPLPNSKYLDMRTAIETAYQSALMFLATRTYDPAIDLRQDDWDPNGSIGLTADEEALMQTIVKDVGGVQAVTYQVVGPKNNPNPEEEGQNYLYGYTRTFEQTVQDIIESLKLKQPVLIGSIETDESGAVYSPHLHTITGAFVDPRDRQLKFTVADSDDNIPTLVVHSARDLVPKIHHATYALKVARRINDEIKANPSYFIPDRQDASRFDLLTQLTDPAPMPYDMADPAQRQQPSQAQRPYPQPIAQFPTIYQSPTMVSIPLTQAPRSFLPPGAPSPFIPQAATFQPEPFPTGAYPAA